MTEISNKKFTTSSNVYFKRKDCLKELFNESRKGNCLYTKLEQKNKKLVQVVSEDVFRFMSKIKENRFQNKYHIKCTGERVFNLFCELSLAENKNPSMYLHKIGLSTTMVGLQAGSEAAWRDECTQRGDLNFLNAHAVNVLLHMKLSKALKSYAKSDTWRQRIEEIGLHSIGLEEISTLHMFFSNHLNNKRKKITIRLIPCIKIHEYCLHYAKDWFGGNISHLIARPNKMVPFDPSLQWTSSYHEHEFLTMATFPTNITLESFYGILIFMRSDSVLKSLPRDIILHVFLETTNHMSRWLEMNFERQDSMKDADHNAMMDNFFRNLRQRLESNFVPNNFNQEINQLINCDVSDHQIHSIINKLKSILRGSCECCRGSLQQNISKLTDRKRPRSRSPLIHNRK